MVQNETRRGFLTVAGAGAVTALAGCSGDSEPSTDGESSNTETSSGNSSGDEEEAEFGSGGTLQMMATGSIQTLDPINAKGSGAGYNQYNKPLMHFPNGMYPPEGALAEDYSMSDDGLTYTFQLRDDAVFHNGDPVTAEDFVYSYRRLAGSENSRNQDDIIGQTMTIDHEKEASRAAPEDETTLDDYVPGSLAVEAVDETTFEFTLRSPFQYTLFQIAGGT
ncbi:ABC transporter substrate-binding protein, partial [Halorubrum sp. Atlit-26R]|uniref:ABC transporter substrate-binding protein n=1 Tax=Halorubrum sp. Atlit-26R TaxID=2282128 RepID=UPI000F24F32B